MLSILIPCYNFDVRGLVQELHEQTFACSVAFEIICLEDASEQQYTALNSEITALSYVQHDSLETNVGRSKIRNLLAQRAQYPFLLFMDCDSWPADKQYIQRYIHQLEEDRILYGGRCYKTHPPAKKDRYFHWYYGRHREQQTAQQRQKRPYHSFMTNNFIIPKALFLPIGFEERLTLYGHEDTLFGLELERRQYPILHLDNPLEHIGLEKASTFLDKSKQAVYNLWYLYQNELLPSHATKLLAWHHQLKNLRLSFFLRWCYWLFHRALAAQLQSKRPFLVLFDLYKLSYLAFVANRATGKDTSNTS
jgi:glycosyltransferase involved in cell wall biosynthesis